MSVGFIARVAKQGVKKATKKIRKKDADAMRKAKKKGEAKRGAYEYGEQRRGKKKDIKDVDRDIKKAGRNAARSEQSKRKGVRQATVTAAAVGTTAVAGVAHNVNENSKITQKQKDAKAKQMYEKPWSGLNMNQKDRVLYKIRNK